MCFSIGPAKLSKHQICGPFCNMFGGFFSTKFGSLSQMSTFLKYRTQDPRLARLPKKSDKGYKFTLKAGK